MQLTSNLDGSRSFGFLVSPTLICQNIKTITIQDFRFPKTLGNKYESGKNMTKILQAKSHTQHL